MPSNIFRQSKELNSSLREKKQVGRFMLPDAPQKKPKKRATSPERIVCPLVPGTPETPPAYVPQAWELKKRKITSTDASPFRFCTGEDEPANSTERDTQIPTASPGCQTPGKTAPSTSKVIFTPSTGIEKADDLSKFHVVESEVELVGFSEPVSPAPDALNARSTPPSPLAVPLSSSIFDDGETENAIAEWELTIGNNPGSDVDDGDGEGYEIDLPKKKSINLEDLPPDVIHVVEELDKRDDALLRQMTNEDMLHFEWASENIFVGQRETFTGDPGPTFNTEALSPFQIFEKIWNADILLLIVRETNKYAEDLKNYPQLKEHAAIKKWVPLTVAELWVFLSIIMFQSLVPIPVEAEYWRPRFNYLKIGKFEDFMSFHRFKLIKRCLHFVDNLSSTNIPNKLGKILPIIEHLNNKFSSLYLPDQNIAIDESLMLWKGRLSFAQLINTKAARVGIKSYELCESKTGYLWKMKFYTGKGQNTTELPEAEPEATEPDSATSKIVFDLVRPLLNRGHTLVMDNFYNSPLLSRALKARKTDTMGTLRLNREFVPYHLKTKAKSNMSHGEIAFSQTNDLTIVVWRDANIVSLISSYHPVGVGGKEKYGRYRYKPQVVLDYNLSMGGIDRKDQLLQAFPVERVRNMVWYKKLFRRLLNVSILNAHIIFNTSGTKISSREYRSLLADEILRRFRPLAPTTAAVPAAAFHFPAKNSKLRARCKICSSRTVWKCESCNINMCLPDCFKRFHLTNQM